MAEHMDIWVCVDCYFAHHYGAHEHEGQWYAGESDTPADREPLALMDGYELADNTDSGTGDGIDEFSWRSCSGCGSTLGGARYRLAVFELGRREGGISADGLALGHRYVMGNVNAYCPQCSDEHSAAKGRTVTVLDCDYDIDK